jgi:hypothetical protein
MFNPKQVHTFCNLEMATNGKLYIKVIKGSKQFDNSRMANEFVFQHALEQTDQYPQILHQVMIWWNQYVQREKWLKQ